MRSKDVPNIHKLLNKRIMVKTQRKKFEGILKGHDAFMNLTLVNLENYECVVVRGDNIKNIEMVE